MWLRWTAAAFMLVACGEIVAAAPAAGTAPLLIGAASPQAANAAQNDPPVFASPDSTPRNDGLDDWCRGDISAVNVAICGDNELRALAAQRLAAFDDAKAHLNADQQQALAADQNGWAMSYAQSCGVQANIRPTLPLAPSVKECMLRAGQARLSYLRTYAAHAAASTQPPGTANPAIVPPQGKVIIPPVLTPPAAPASGTSSSSGTAPVLPPAPQPPPQQASGTPPQASAPSAPPAEPGPPAVKPAPAPSSPPPQSGSHDPFAADRAPSLTTLQGKAMLLIVLLAAGLVMLWVIVLVRRRSRSRPGPAE